MKIYTRAGDHGTTSLLGGNLVSKDHPRLEAYGTLDELNSWIGFLRDHLEDKRIKEDLLIIQGLIMTGSSILASEKGDKEVNLPEIKEENILLLEARIDEMEAGLPVLASFILPGGHPTVSICHLARVTCRRAERYSVPFIENSAQTEILVKFLNRLSDYLFVLARKIGNTFKVEEILWEPDL